MFTADEIVLLFIALMCIVSVIVIGVAFQLIRNIIPRRTRVDELPGNRTVLHTNDS